MAKYLLSLKANWSCLKQSAALLKANVADVPKRIEGLNQQLKEAARKAESLQSKLSAMEAGSTDRSSGTSRNTQVLAARVDAPNMDALRTVADELKVKLPNAVLVLGAPAGWQSELCGCCTC